MAEIAIRSRVLNWSNNTLLKNKKVVKQELTKFPLDKIFEYPNQFMGPPRRGVGGGGEAGGGHGFCLGAVRG